MYSQTFVKYIRAIVSSPCLARTVHENVKQGSNSLGDNPLPLWEQLKQELGEQEAERRVQNWINNPYKLY